MSSSEIGWARLALGVAQGIAFYFLYSAFQEKTWPAIDGLLFSPLLLVATFVPAIVIVGLGTVRVRALVAFALAATVLIAALAVYDIWRSAPPELQIRSYVIGGKGHAYVLPSYALVQSLMIALFIAFGLVAASNMGAGPSTRYARHFDVAWKLAVQLVLVWLFIGVFWLLLWLGAGLFRLIKLEFLYELFKQRWFSIPVTAVVFALAMHVTDVQAGLVRGARTLVLTLFAWLLPLMTLIVAAFLAALVVTGLEPLWGTKRATSLLLTAAFALVFLINAAYQDGEPDNPAPPILRYARIAAAAVLIPLVALAAYALVLRVAQYGWTPQRVTVVAVLIVIWSYAVGYAYAAVRYGGRLKGLESTNFFTAYLVLAALFALLTPIADPARLAVADQLRRLEAGKVWPFQFDFMFLRFKAGRFGIDALEQLALRRTGPHATAIAEKAAASLKSTHWEPPRVDPATPQTRAANITIIHPSGQPLPDGFVQQNWISGPAVSLPGCLTYTGKCDAILTDLDDDGTPEVLLIVNPYGSAFVFKSAQGGNWSSLGMLLNANCPGVRDALRDGKFSVVAPALKDLEVNGQRLRVGSNCVKDRSTIFLKQ
jgi:hypothetical protein